MRKSQDEQRNLSPKITKALTVKGSKEKRHKGNTRALFAKIELDRNDEN
ncbi:hypothetical protein [Bartonella tribocorum]|nr:hypothetical protein [Bartonella tribocorum]